VGAGLAIAGVLWSGAATAQGEPKQAEESRPPLPEPILQETATDIDGTDPGEMELEANVSMLRSRVGGAFALELSPEIEVLLTRHLGAKVNPFFERAADAGGSATSSGGVSGALSWKLVQDLRDDFYLQAEAGGRAATEVSTSVDPGESALPFSLDLQSGFRRGLWTLRNTVGASAGGASPHVPLHGGAVLLTEFDASGRCGFWGVEFEADGARANPFVVALDLVPNLTPAGLPFALGFVLPYSVGADGRAPSYGLFVRLFVESAREQSYARSGELR
jgi:hypothetical protein